MDNRISVHAITVAIVLLIALVCAEIDPEIWANDPLPDNITKENQLYSNLNSDNKIKNFKNVSIAIIGAGFSGLAAYEKLLSEGFNQIDLFEASSRIGGRVYSVPFEDGFLQHGAQFINGNHNPIFDMAFRLGLVTGEVEDDELFQNANYQTGRCEIKKSQVNEFENFVEKLEEDYLLRSTNPKNWNTTVGFLFKKSYKNFLKSKRRSKKEVQVFEALSRFYQSYHEGEWSAPIDKLCLKNFATWDDKTTTKLSSYTLNKYGYTAILNELAKNLPSIHLNSKISLIDYSGNRIKLKLLDGRTYQKEYDYVISTIPLGHLKLHAKHLFHPRLPQRKLDAIDAFGFGSLLKIFLVYEKPFWSQNITSLMPIFVEGCAPESYLSRELHTFEPLDWNPNVLVGWLSGNGPKTIDNLSDEELIKHVTKHFREAMPDLQIALPKKIIRTSWLRDDNFKGSYTFITNEAALLQSDPFELLARPVYSPKNRLKLLFAGEATHSRIYQTTIGAYLSGRREVDRLMNYLSKNALKNTLVEEKRVKTC